MPKKESLLFSCLVCFLFYEFFFSYSASEIFIPVSALIISVLSLLFASKTNILRYPKILTVMFILYISASVISGTTNGFTYETFIVITGISANMLLFHLFYNLAQDRGLRNKLMVFLILVSATWSLISISEFSARIKFLQSQPLILPFFQPAINADFFLMCFPVSLIYYLAAKNKTGMSVFFITSQLILSALFLMKQYRIPFYIETAAAIAVYLSLTRHGERKFFFQKILILLLTSVALLPNLFAASGSNTINDQTSAFLYDSIFYDRNLVEKFTGDYRNAHILTGFGPGKIGHFFNSQLTLPYKNISNIQNSLLDVYLDTGLISLGTVLAIFAYITVYCLYQFKKWRKNKRLDQFAVIIGICTFFYLFPQSAAIKTFPVMTVFFLLVSFLFSENKDSIGRTIFIRIFLTILSVCYFIVVSDSILFDRVKRLSLNQKFEPYRNISGYLTLRPSFMINPKIFVWESAAYLDQRNYTQAKIALRWAKQADRFNPEYDYQLAKIEYLEGKLPQAIAILENSVTSSPLKPPKFYSDLAYLYGEESELALSKTWLLRASDVYNPKIINDLSKLQLYTLENLHLLSDLRDIYYSLYQLDPSEKYLNTLITLNFF